MSTKFDEFDEMLESFEAWEEKLQQYLIVQDVKKELKVKTLRSKYRPASSIIVERYKFWNLKQSADRSVADYVAAIKDQAALCKFNNFLQGALRDRLVSGLHDSHIKKALLGESSDITFEKACERAISMETAETQSKVVQGSHTAEEQVKKIVKGEKKRNGEKSSKFQVWGKCCGRKHDPKTCPAADWKCFICDKKGHISTVCRAKKSTKVKLV